MKYKWFDPRPLTRASACFWAFLFSVIIMAVAAVKHAAYAEALAPGVSGVGEGILISYMLMWPGAAIFMMLLAEGMYEERRFSKHLFGRSALGGILPVLINYGFVLLVSKLSYPWNSYVAVSAVPTAVIVPMVVFALAITERWPFSILPRVRHEQKRSA